MSVRLLRTCAFNVMLAAMLVLPGQPPAKAEPPSPFDKLAGRWVGEGRFGVRDGTTEAVKCRVTYIISGDGHDELKQSIRCASAGELAEEIGRTHYVHSIGRDKEVRYFLMTASGEPEARNEIDEVRWVPLDEARTLLTHERDRALLDSL